MHHTGSIISVLLLLAVAIVFVNGEIIPNASEFDKRLIADSTINTSTFDADLVAHSAINTSEIDNNIINGSETNTSAVATNSS